MNVLHAVGLKDVGPFESVQFKIEPGLTTIYGLNRSSGKASSNSNFVGKSLLFSSVSDTFYDEPIVGERTDRIRHGTRVASFTNAHGKKILVRRIAKGKTEKIQILEDGVDLKLRTSTIAKEYLANSWPLTQTDYSTFVHIDSRAPHPLVMGSSAERKRFFTEFFNLDKLDAEKKLYAARLRELAKIRAAYDELFSQYKKTQERSLSDVERADLEQRRDTLAESLERLQDEVSAIQSTIRLMQFGVSAKQQIQTLASAYGIISEEVIEQATADNKWELKDVEEKLGESRAWDQYRRDNALYIKAINALSPEAKAFLKEHGRNVAQKLAKNAASNAVRCAAEMSTIDDRLDKIERLLRKDAIERVDAPAEDEQDLRVLQRTYEHHLDHSKKFGKGTCETCGQPVTVKDPNVIYKKLDAIRRKLEQHEAAKRYATVVARRRELKQEHATLMTTHETLEAERKKTLPIARLFKEIRDLPSKPEEFTGKKLQTEVLEKMKAEITERRELLKFVAPHIGTIVEYLALTDEQIKAAKNLDELAEKMNRVQAKYTQALTKLEVDDTIGDQLEEMRTRLRQMKRELRDEPHVKLLVQGYSDKNIKKLAVDAISERLMTLVNSYAARVYQENLQFEFVWDTDVQLLVHRQTPGKKPSTTDVRKLSGAESLFFTLILVCALLNFVPSHKRCNVMILDEPTAHLSPENIEILQDVLKILNGLVPSIIVITPHSEEIYEGARAYTIVKRNGVSVLKKGMPHEIVN